MSKRTLFLILACLCSAPAVADEQRPFGVNEIASFREPWALAFLPDGGMLVTEKRGRLYIVGQDGEKSEPLGGVPDVSYGGQGGLGDVAIHPDFETNRLVYLSYAEAGDDDTRGAAVARGRLDDDARALESVKVIWRQVPKVTGRGHYGHRLLFDADGKLFVSSGERQKFDPSQDMDSNLGKILRLNDDGTPAAGNPFADRGGVSAEIWSLGHRNPLGIAFDADGQLWNVEMGPRGGDELNRVAKGSNYGYPEVSNGRHYSGRNIPDHDTRDDFVAPAAWWTPVISPGGMLIYKGDSFPAWRGNAIIAGLSSQSLVRVELDGDKAREAERFDMGERMRAVVEGPDGDIWVLADAGRLLRLSPNQGGSKGAETGWRKPSLENLMIMTLPQGEVWIELAPQFAPATVGNIRTLIANRYFDGLAIIRSHDNYVVQWGDPNADGDDARSIASAAERVVPEFFRARDGLEITEIDSRDPYADNVGFVDGFPMAWDDGRAWLSHCYGMVGVGRGMDAGSGNGSSLYVVTGHAPRHLDKNITLVGRVLHGMSHLSTLPRGTGVLGFYETEDELTPIESVRLAISLKSEPDIEVMDTRSDAFQEYVESRTHRTGEWFIDPVGKIELCNLHPPVRTRLP